MIVKQMNKTGDVFKNLIRESRSDLAFLKNQLMECIEDTDTLEGLVDDLEGRIQKNEDVIGFKYYAEVNQDDQLEDPDQISVN